MAFQLQKKETISEGIERAVRQQIEKAVARLRDGRDPDKTVFEIRKRFKRVRTALRLVRNDLGDAVYRRENFLIRDAGRALAEARDAAVRVKTFDNLIKNSEVQIHPEAARKVHALLTEKHKAITQRLLRQEVFAKVAAAIKPVLARIEDWSIRQVNGPPLSILVQRMYEKGGRALSIALVKSSVENLHELRKQAKYLRIGLKFFKSRWIGDEKKLSGQVHNLTRLLGDNHDLAVLRHVLSADPLAYGNSGALDHLFAVIHRSREKLKRQALTLGRLIYRDSPTGFTKRVVPQGIRPHTSRC